MLWLTLGRIFNDIEQLDFIWIFSLDDMDEMNRMPDGIGSMGCVGVVKDVEP